MDKNLLANAGGMGLIPDPERSRKYKATTKPSAATTEAYMPRACALKQEKPW